MPIAGRASQNGFLLISFFVVNKRTNRFFRVTRTFAYPTVQVRCNTYAFSCMAFENTTVQGRQAIQI